VENTSSTLIAPSQYEQYCIPQVGTYAGMVRDAGRRLILHMCGHLKDMLPHLSTIPATAFEAYTMPPVGDATLFDARSLCPDVCLIGGTSAVSWLKPAEAIIAEIQDRLDELPHHRGIVITSAGVMPPACSPETIKTVRDWVAAYPLKQ